MVTLSLGKALEFLRGEGSPCGWALWTPQPQILCLSNTEMSQQRTSSPTTRLTTWGKGCCWKRAWGYRQILRKGQCKGGSRAEGEPKKHWAKSISNLPSMETWEIAKVSDACGHTKEGILDSSKPNSKSHSWNSSRRTCAHIPRHFCFCSVAQSCPTLWNPMDCNTPGFPVLHYLLEIAQNHIHWVSDAIQPSPPLSSPSPPTFNFYQHQGLFQWVSSSHQVA